MELLDISREVFMEIPNEKYARQMTEFLSIENMRSLVNGQVSMPEVDEQGMIVVRSAEPQGSFSTKNLENRNASLKYELHLPATIDELIDDGELVISVSTTGT